MSRPNPASEQLCFPGLDPTPTDRLFFALLPEAPAAQVASQVVASLRGPCGLTGRALGPGRFHVSLHGLGDYAGLPPAVVTQARMAGSIASSMATSVPFGVAFDHARSFPRRRRKMPLVLVGVPLVSPVTPLMAFQRALGVAMIHAGLGDLVSSHFAPHMTLIYDTRYVEPRAVPPVAWTAREFVLIHSLLGQTRYIQLGRWPLRGHLRDAGGPMDSRQLRQEISA